MKARWTGHALPPGDFIRRNPMLTADRKALIAYAENAGPIITTISGHRIHICVLSLATARRLLAQHREDLKALSIDLGSIVPKGFLRTMEGTDHKTYRRLFSRAMAGGIAPSAVTDVRAILDKGVGCLRNGDKTDTADQGVLEQMGLRLLVRTLLGVRLQTAAFEEIEEQFRAMGPNGFVWKVGTVQKAAFAKISDHLLALIAEPDAGAGIASDSVLGRLGREARTGSTTIGNLIYMVEMGRADLQSLFSWIIHFIGNDQSIVSRIAAGEQSPSGPSIAEAVTLETLRMEQSIALMRAAKRDFVFDGFLIPKGAVVPICLWEAHKDASTFENASTFDADRFLQNAFDADQFSPFGLGHHGCPAAETTIQISSLFVETYARAYAKKSPEHR